MEYNFNIPVYSYEYNTNAKDSQTGEDIALSRILANTLATDTQGNPLKMMYWAIELYKGNKLVLDQVDSDILKAFIENSNLMNMIKYQLLTIIKNE